MTWLPPFFFKCHDCKKNQAHGSSHYQLGGILFLASVFTSTSANRQFVSLSGHVRTMFFDLACSASPSLFPQINSPTICGCFIISPIIWLFYSSTISVSQSICISSFHYSVSSSFQTVFVILPLNFTNFINCSGTSTVFTYYE